MSGPFYWEDFQVGDEDEFGHYQVTREEIIDFASKYDPQSFHLSDEAAAQSIFGQLCASGWHNCAMLMRLMVDNMKNRGIESLGSPGIDEIRWLKPVFVGDVLRACTTVVETRPSNSRPDIGSVKSQYQLVNDRDEVVMTMQGIGLFRRRPAAS